MAATVTKTLLFTSGEIRWSDLRDAFKGSGTQINASELRRNTTASAADPIVPDATENAAVASSTNWRASQMRNTIKTYDITQTGTNNNNSSLSSVGFNIGTQSWNSNLGKNIKKRMIINGTIGSANTGQYAAYLNAFVYNLRVEVNGYIYGQGGIGGGDRFTQFPSGPYESRRPNGKGGAGGPALYVKSTGGKVNVVVGGSARIYGGGGGGSRGAGGARGASSTCSATYDYNTGLGCNYCPGCAAGETRLSCSDVGTCRSGKGWRHPYYRSRCRHTYYYSVPGAPGGRGGFGGDGQGYTRTRTDSPNFNQSYESNGIWTAGPTYGANGGCPTYGGNGKNGERGSHGGTWGASSAKTSAYAGASSGRAISGSNYQVTGSVSATTLKGAYQP